MGFDAVWGANESDANFTANNLAAALRRRRPRAKSSASRGCRCPFALSNPVSYPLVLIVVGWAMLLFFGFGLMSKGHVMTLVALFVGACAAASAVLMILDLSIPYSGIFRASPAPLEQVLAVIGKE
jgi:hypothetical protein